MIDINIKGVLYGIVAALPVFRAQGSGHFVTIASTAGLMAVYAATKFAVRAISEGLRQEAGEKLRVTLVTPGFVHADFVSGINDPVLRGQLEASRNRLAITPDAIAFAIDQPPEVDVGEIVIRPTTRGHGIASCSNRSCRPSAAGASH